MLSAELRTVAGQLYLKVYRAIWLRLDTEPYSTVVRFLDDHVYRVISEDTHNDDEMAGQQGIRTVYQILGRREAPERKTCLYPSLMRSSQSN
jgi:hypothetical protein